MAEELKITKSYIETQFSNYHNKLSSLVNNELDKKQNKLTVDSNFFKLENSDLKLNAEVDENTSGFFYWDGSFKFLQSNEKTTAFVPGDDYYRQGALINKTPVSRSELYFYGGSDRINTVGEITNGKWNSEGVSIKNNSVSADILNIDTINNSNNRKCIDISSDYIELCRKVFVTNETFEVTNGNIEISGGSFKIRDGSTINISMDFTNGYIESKGDVTAIGITTTNSTTTNLTVNGKKFTTVSINSDEDFDTWVD